MSVSSTVLRSLRRDMAHESTGCRFGQGKCSTWHSIAHRFAAKILVRGWGCLSKKGRLAVRDLCSSSAGTSADFLISTLHWHLPRSNAHQYGRSVQEKGPDSQFSQTCTSKRLLRGVQGLHFSRFGCIIRRNATMRGCPLTKHSVHPHQPCYAGAFYDALWWRMMWLFRR